MKERVSCIIGKKPVILIAPHGADDTHTDSITELAADVLGCYAVINRGFEREKVADIDNDKADCNRVDHVKLDVIFEEFLKPIIKFQERISSKGSPRGMWVPFTPNPVHIFHIHGCGDIVHKEVGEPVEVIVGYGLGSKKDSLSCDVWRKNLLVDLFRKYASDGDVFEASGGSRYGGRDSNNMNQYFRKHDHKPWVHSMQLEFPFSLREQPTDAATTAIMLATVLDDYLKYEQYDLEPEAKMI